MSHRWNLDIQTMVGGFQLGVSIDCSANVLALYGPSGAGKSTLVECLAGVRSFSGHARLDDKSRAHWRVGWVPQDGTLFPHLSVVENIDYSGRRGASRDQAIEVLGLSSLLERRPQGLSGGEQQRVALARALASEPDLLLLDEPLNGVDLMRRAQIFRLLQSIRDVFRIPMLYVSHDPLEVQAMADHVCLMSDGCIESSGQPKVLLEEARKLRSMHWLDD